MNDEELKVDLPKVSREPRRLLTTPRIDSAYQAYLAMDSAREDFFRPNFFGFRRSAQDISEFCQELGRLRAALWCSVYEQYPHVKDGIWSISGCYITETLPDGESK